MRKIVRYRLNTCFCRIASKPKCYIIHKLYKKLSSSRRRNTTPSPTLAYDLVALDENKVKPHLQAREAGRWHSPPSSQEEIAVRFTAHGHSSEQTFVAFCLAQKKKKAQNKLKDTLDQPVWGLGWSALL